MPASYAFHRAFPAAFATGSRTFAADYLLFASAGAFVLEIGERRWLLPPQRAALIPKGLPVSVSSNGPATSSSVLFCNGEFSNGLSRLRVFAISDLAVLMIARAMQWGEDAQPGRLRNVFFQALADLVSELSEAEQNTWLPQAQSAGLKAALALGTAELDKDVELPTLASAAGMSERSLARRFREELGLGWSEYRHRARMIRAMELLATAEPVTNVALDVGFESTSAFIRAFRQFSGQTPTAYRRAADRSIKA